MERDVRHDYEPKRLLERIGHEGPDLAAVSSSRSVVAGERALPGIVEDVLNFALTLEYLEAEFYTMGVGAPGLLAGTPREVFDLIRKHEVAHVALLQGVLGSRAVAKPTFDFTAGGVFADVFSNAKTFMALAQAFEDTGVRAYKGQAANLMGRKDILETALRVHSVEARHAAQIRRLRGQKGWITGSSRGDLPEAVQAIYDGEANTFQILTATLGGGLGGSPGDSEAFDETLTKGQVLRIVRPFIRSNA
ncbi:MAG: ferritin-like domain-containing protein [Gemmatimonadaceae bacterium]